MCVVPVVSIQYATTKQPVCIQHFIIVIEKATCFGCSRELSPGSTFQKYKNVIIQLQLYIQQ